MAEDKLAEAALAVLAAWVVAEWRKEHPVEPR